MANILLIKTQKKEYSDHYKAASPPLGLTYIAAYARENRPKKDTFTIMDERIHPRSDDEWTEFLEKLKPDIIGLSTMSIEQDQLEYLLPLFRKAAPEALLIQGGPLASSSGASLLDALPLDYVIKGEGEIPFFQLLESLDGNQDYPLNRIGGLAFKDPKGAIVDNPPSEKVENLDALPYPAYDLIDLRDYVGRDRMTPVRLTQLYAPLFTSRGCPYHCIYCHDIFSGKFRAMSAMRVVDEIEHMVDKFGVHEFEIYDDIFNLDKQRVKDICAEIKRRGLETYFTFPNGVRGDILDRETLEALKDMGTVHMAFAIETASPRLQKILRKNINLEKIRENIAIATDLKIFTWGFLMMGLPKESRWELWKTIWFATSSKLHGAFFFPVVPFEGTELAKKYEKTIDSRGGKRLWDYFLPEGSLGAVGPRELTVMHSLAFFIFFFNPWRVYLIYTSGVAPFSRLVSLAFGIARYIVVDKILYTLKTKVRKIFNFRITARTA
ncbi:MAG: B12-binding domain-containing radical SAM protein [Desulfatibacillum sp.]|nr:B12-binding domain-containing radical SAM protein [Desulfatibacillum sp.]